MSKKLKISIIVPSYREENYIEKTLLDIKAVLEKITEDFEIICIVDGVVDNTFELASKVSKKFPKVINVVGYLRNRGKGFAVRLGFELAKGDLIGFIDADGQIDPKVLGAAIARMKKENADMVIGSKHHPDSSLNYPLFRRIVSFVSQSFIKILFNIEVSDTQAGVKVITRDLAKKLTPRLCADRFGFDIELLSVAKRLGYANIKEIPIKVRFLNEEVSVKNLALFYKDVFKTFLETCLIFYRLKVDRYYDDNNKDNWRPFIKPSLLKA